MSNAARNKGVSEKHILDWQNQLENAEREGNFAFTAYSVLTSAYNWWTLIPIHEIIYLVFKVTRNSVQQWFRKEKAGLLY